MAPASGLWRASLPRAYRPEGRRPLFAMCVATPCRNCCTPTVGWSAAANGGLVGLLGLRHRFAAAPGLPQAHEQQVMGVQELAEAHGGLVGLVGANGGVVGLVGLAAPCARNSSRPTKNCRVATLGCGPSRPTPS